MLFKAIVCVLESTKWHDSLMETKNFVFIILSPNAWNRKQKPINFSSKSKDHISHWIRLRAAHLHIWIKSWQSHWLRSKWNLLSYQNFLLSLSVSHCLLFVFDIAKRILFLCRWLNAHRCVGQLWRTNPNVAIKTRIL